jgi:hypothetical protein
MKTKRLSALACAAGLATTLMLGTPSPGVAQDTVTVKPKALNATFKKIETQSLRMDLLFNGKMGDRAIKNSKLAFEIVEDRVKEIRIVSFSGPAIGLMINDPTFAKLGVRSMSLIESQGEQYIQLQGSVSVCVKPPKNDKSLTGLMNQLTPDRLLKESKLDRNTFKGKLLKSERVGTETAKKYEVLDLQSIKDPAGDKQYIWVADKGEYITKFEVTVPADGKQKNGFADGFVGNQRITYTILSINKPVKAVFPAACKNAIQG